MGEIAEMMLEGILCESCGVFLGGDAAGYPRYCADCAAHSVDEEKIEKPKKTKQKKRKRK